MEALTKPDKINIESSIRQGEIGSFVKDRVLKDNPENFLRQQ